jgi:hypothetical protein
MINLPKHSASHKKKKKNKKKKKKKLDEKNHILLHNRPIITAE